MKHTSNHKFISVACTLVSFICVLSAMVLAIENMTVAAGNTYYVSTTGVNTNPGTLQHPWRTIEYGIEQLEAGDTLYVRGGTYTERIRNWERDLNPGTKEDRITVQAYSSERPVIKGLFWVEDANYWTFDGINVTWDDATGQDNEHMVKLLDGEGWRFTNAEVWGAKSFANVLVGHTPDDWMIDHNYIHDTYPTNGINQDHLIYVDTFIPNGESGVIERNILAHSANGRGVKIGPGSPTSNPGGGVVIRYNTFYNNTGPANVQFSYNATNNKVYRNIMQKPKSGYENVTTFNLNGTNNKVYDNIGFESDGVVESDPGVDASRGGNIYRDPQFNNLTDFIPQDSISKNYGHTAPLEDKGGGGESPGDGSQEGGAGTSEGASSSGGNSGSGVSNSPDSNSESSSVSADKSTESQQSNGDKSVNVLEKSLNDIAQSLLIPSADQTTTATEPIQQKSKLPQIVLSILGGITFVAGGTFVFLHFRSKAHLLPHHNQ